MCDRDPVPGDNPRERHQQLAAEGVQIRLMDSHEVRSIYLLRPDFAGRGTNFSEAEFMQ